MVNMKQCYYLLHAMAYYTAWFAGTMLAARGHAWISCCVVMACVSLQCCCPYHRVCHRPHMLNFIELLLLLSTLVDSILVGCRVMLYQANPFAPYMTAPWMMALWASFAIMLCTLLSSLFRHLYVLGLLSLVGFTLAYALAAHIGAVLFPYGVQTCWLIGIIWFFLLPLAVRMTQLNRS